MVTFGASYTKLTRWEDDTKFTPGYTKSTRWDGQWTINSATPRPETECRLHPLPVTGYNDSPVPAMLQHATGYQANKHPFGTIIPHMQLFAAFGLFIPINEAL